MEKQQRWQFALIATVILLTLYNILPTIFYYAQPLRAPVDEARAMQVAQDMVYRVNGLEQEAEDWISAYCSHVGLSPTSIELDRSNPRLIFVHLQKSGEAATLKRLIPQAGTTIPFQPAQLTLSAVQPEDDTVVAVERQIGVHIDDSSLSELFRFTEKLNESGQAQPIYAELVADRLSHLSVALAGNSTQGLQLEALIKASAQVDSDQADLSLRLARELNAYTDAFGKDSPIAGRFFGSFSRTQSASATQIQQFSAKLDAVKVKIESEKDLLVQERDQLKAQGAFLDTDREQLLRLYETQIATLDSAATTVREEASRFLSAEKPLTREEILSAFTTSSETSTIDLGQRHPFIQSVVIDWGTDRMICTLHPDVQALRTTTSGREEDDLRKERLQTLLVNEIAQVGRTSDEELTPQSEAFAVALNGLTDSRSLLLMDLGQLATQRAELLNRQLSGVWQPNHADLQRSTYPVLDYASFQDLSTADRKLGLVIYAPAAEKSSAARGFRTSSIYVLARGLKNIVDKYQAYPESKEAQELLEDVTQLRRILGDQGFFGYPAAAYGFDKEFENDFIFELNDYYSSVVAATREKLIVKGSHRYSVLEFSDVEQRTLTTNRIEESVQEDLLKWREEYHSAQADLRPARRLMVPPPTKSVYLQNLRINARKYFRGDDRKILRWGLDLSGGKSVRIGLRDQANQPVTDPEDLKQAVNELYTRINAMGVSERSIRIENAHILLDFPGVQGLAADDLIQASAMYFHIVNEKFSPANSNLHESVQTFLQDVWNEAVVTNRKDNESINLIAWEHLGGDTGEAEGFRPRSEAARILYDNGLRFAAPKDTSINNAFNDSISSLAMWRGEDYTEWHGQTHPLLVVFRNYALEGSSLSNVQAGYDPSSGNILTFGVRSSYTSRNQPGDPRDDFYSWTSQFAKSKVVGTIREAYSRGEGWRMAVVLNGTVISAPVLNEPLRDQALISGSFSQREVNRLAADLKAGSLSFTPKILSETNVSPDLGEEERFWGISAALLGLLAVVVAMVSYYRFAGVVASCAVFLNLLIMWGVLQNLDAALTLPGIAGIILTVGMAVDANVLVFERIREEFKLSGRLASAVGAGYRKAFSAIIDSNVTTIIAALILIQFDSGPVKGFAVTLIIGILSSMFTALFMTRYFFAGWVRKAGNTELKMSELLGNTKFDFLSKWKAVAIGSLSIMAVGGFLLFSQWQSILGMDFTGGYAVTVRLEEQTGQNYRDAAAAAFDQAGALAGDLEVRQLNRPNQLRVQMGFSAEEEGHVFHGMPERVKIDDGQPEYLKNPRLAWVVSALENSGLQIKEANLNNLDKDWTLMSGQFSEVMRNNALLALGCALLSILVYLTFRFEFKFAISAILALMHDVFVSLSLLGILYWVGMPIQINLEVIGAIMTIIGYSLNDTIIVFDRIREDTRLMKKSSLEDVVNHALNVTLSRTLITSGTTLLVLFALVLLGGSAIFDLALVMTIGVLFGTISSLFVASPIMLFFHRRELQREGHSLKVTKA